MLQRHLAEREQPHLHPGRVAPRLSRHVRPADIRGRPDRSQQVLDHGPVQHLLGGDAEDHRAPPLHGRKLISPQPRACRAFQAERGVEVLAHQAMLKLSSLGQQIGQLLAVFHYDGRLAHKGTLPLAMAVLKRLDAVAGGRQWPDQSLQRHAQAGHCAADRRPIIPSHTDDWPAAPSKGVPDRWRQSAAARLTSQPCPGPGYRVKQPAGTVGNRSVTSVIA